MRRCWYLFATGLLITGCDAAQNVDVLPLPALERPSPEARLGLPEVEGQWAFAGWEIESGDSTVLERTFPSFGQLFIETQRLDSIAGMFQISGANVPVIGDVRRDGHMALVTIRGGAPANYLAGIFAQDTVWLEVTSILQPEEWPQNARAAFVRERGEAPFAWIRGTRVVEEPVDTMATMAADSLGGDSIATLPGPANGGLTPPTGGANGGSLGGPQPATVPGPGNTPTPSGGQGAAPSRPAPSQPAPSQPAPSQPAPQPSAEPTPPADEPEDEPEPEVEIPEPEIEVDIPDLLGAPVGQ